MTQPEPSHPAAAPGGGQPSSPDDGPRADAPTADERTAEEATADVLVARSVAPLAQLDAVPLEQHARVYEEVHARLDEVLRGAHGGPAPSPSSGTPDPRAPHATRAPTQRW